MTILKLFICTQCDQEDEEGLKTAPVKQPMALSNLKVCNL